MKTHAWAYVSAVAGEPNAILYDTGSDVSVYSDVSLPPAHIVTADTDVQCVNRRQPERSGQANRWDIYQNTL